MTTTAGRCLLRTLNTRGLGVECLALGCKDLGTHALVHSIGLLVEGATAAVALDLWAFVGRWGHGRGALTCSVWSRRSVCVSKWMVHVRAVQCQLHATHQVPQQLPHYKLGKCSLNTHTKQQKAVSTR